MTTSPIKDDVDREPTGSEIELVETLRDAASDSIRAEAYEARLRKIGFTPQGLSAMAREWRERIKRA